MELTNVFGLLKFWEGVECTDFSALTHDNLARAFSKELTSEDIAAAEAERLPKGWRQWPNGSLKAWYKRPKYMREPDVRTYRGYYICFDCERPKEVRDYCNGSMEIIREPCRYHRAMPDHLLTPLAQHPRPPILLPKVVPDRKCHMGSCIDESHYFISGDQDIFSSIYFKRCDGLYRNALGKELLGFKKSSRLRIDHEAPSESPPFQNSAFPPIPPFPVRFGIRSFLDWSAGKTRERRRFGGALEYLPKRPFDQIALDWARKEYDAIM